MEMIIEFLYYLWPVIAIVSAVAGISFSILSLRSKDDSKKTRNMVISVIAFIVFIVGCISGMVNQVLVKDISYIDTQQKLLDKMIEISYNEDKNIVKSLFATKNDGTQGESELSENEVPDDTQISGPPAETLDKSNTSGNKDKKNTSGEPTRPEESEEPTRPEEPEEPTRLEESEEPEEFSVSVSYRIIPIPLTDMNCQITAVTTLNAECVTVIAVSDSYDSGTLKMLPIDSKKWTFAANFFIEGTYTVTVTAYNTDGTTAKDSFRITYPFN